MDIELNKEHENFKITAFKMTHEASSKGTAYVALTLNKVAAEKLRDDLIAALPLTPPARPNSLEAHVVLAARQFYGEGRPAALEGYPGLSSVPPLGKPDSLETHSVESVTEVESHG